MLIKFEIMSIAKIILFQLEIRPISDIMEVKLSAIDKYKKTICCFKELILYEKYLDFNEFMFLFYYTDKYIKSSDQAFLKGKKLYIPLEKNLDYLLNYLQKMLFHHKKNILIQLNSNEQQCI